MSGLFFLIFLAGVISLIRRADRQYGEEWGVISLAGGIGFAVLGLGTQAVLGSVLIANTNDANLTVQLYQLNNAVGALGGVFAALFFLGIAMATLLRRVFPAWAGWLAIVGAMVALVGVGGVSTDNTVVFTFGLIRLLLVLLWPAVISVWML